MILQIINNNDAENEVDRTKQIFNFVDVPSFVSLLSGSPSEPLFQIHMAILYLLVKSS